MAYTDYLSPVAAGDNDLQKWAKLRAQAKLAVVNAGITIPPVSSNPLLDDVHSGDNDLQKFQKVNAMLSLLATNISGGGGASSIQAANVALSTGVSNLAVAFGTAFAAVPSVVCNLVPPNGGSPILVDPTSITTTGFTAQWGFPVPAGYSIVWIATKTTQ